MWDRARALILGKENTGWGAEGVFCLCEILVQNRDGFLQPRVGFSGGRVPHPGAAETGGESWGTADHGGSRIWLVLKPSCATEFICFRLDYFLSPSPPARVIPMVRSSTFCRAAGWFKRGRLSCRRRLYQPEVPNHSLAAGNFCLWHFVISSISVNPGRQKSCSRAGGKAGTKRGITTAAFSRGAASLSVRTLG